MTEISGNNSPINCSVIIPNLHSPIVDRTIQSILDQDTDLSYEIIVAGMDKFGLVEQFPSVRFIQTPAPVGAGEARNIAIRKARSNKLLFIDSDCIARPGWMAAFFKNFSEGWQVIGGSVISPEDDFWQLVYNLSMFHEQLATQPWGKHEYLATLNLAVNRDVINEVGGLNEALMRGQDIEWTSRMTQAGYQLLFEPDAVIEHHPPRHDFDALWKDNFRSGYYMIQVRHEHPEIFHMPGIMKHAWFWRWFKPLIAAWTTLKIFMKTREVRRHWKIIPYVYKLKVAWCSGATDRLEEKNDEG